MLEPKILELISSRREGAFWDFKEKHHDNKAKLLHDILCLANSLSKTEKYLIYGVSDSDYKIKGVQGEQRRSQADFIDFIRSKTFAGDIRPEVELRTLSFEGKEVDILIIFDHPQKPYYLKEDYRDKQNVVRANYIYSRNLDTNTPIDQSVDIRLVEAMWRERFGLDLQPAEKMLELLRRPEEWDKDIGNKKIAYHKFHPEYQVKFGRPQKFTEVFSYFYINDSSFIGKASFRYLSTELFSSHYIYCDEMRLELVHPEDGFVHVGRRIVRYMYYELDSRNGALLHFMTNGEFNFKSRLSEAAFVLYRDQGERKAFESYLQDNLDELDALPNSEVGEMAQQRIDQADIGGFTYKPVEMIKVCDLFKRWKAI